MRDKDLSIDTEVEIFKERSNLFVTLTRYSHFKAKDILTQKLAIAIALIISFDT